MNLCGLKREGLCNINEYRISTSCFYMVCFSMFNYRKGMNMSSRQRRIDAENKAKMNGAIAIVFLLIITFTVGVLVGSKLI